MREHLIWWGGQLFVSILDFVIIYVIAHALLKKYMRVEKQHVLLGVVFAVLTGDVYPCFMFLGNNQFIMDHVFNRDSTKFELNKRLYTENTIQSIPSCKDCWAQKICNSCHSGCIGANFLQNGSISKPSDDNCKLSKQILEETIYNIAYFADKKGDANRGKI